MNVSSILFKNPIYPLNRKFFEKLYKKTFGRLYQDPFRDSMIEKKIIFVHIPKTGGTSISKALFGKFSGHAYLFEYFLANKSYTQNFYKICVVRNPFDRLVSAYSHLSQKNIRDENKSLLEDLDVGSFDDLIKCLDDSRKCKIIQNTILMLRPQYEFIKHNKIKMDSIYRFEYFHEIKDHLKETLNIEIEIKHLNSTKRLSYKKYYNDYSISVVKKIYKEDLENFNYQF